MIFTMRWATLLLLSLDGTQGPQELAISVNVDLVMLHATVRDRNGVAAGALAAKDFAVYEDGVRQAIRVFQHLDQPVTAGLVVDHSGSMRPRLADVVEAARVFVRSSSAEDEMFVVNFNENVSLGLGRPGVFTNRQDEVAEAIGRPGASGQTALYDAVVAGLEQLRTGSREKKVLLLISDGADNKSVHTQTQAMRMAVRSNAAIYTIGLFADEDPDRNPDVLRRLARATGGEAFFPQEAKQTAAICEQVAGDIRRQYTLGYVSNSTRPEGEFRNIRVVAEAAGRGRLTVRTRTGYVAGSTP
jgi:VWFA-related protein